MDIGTKEDVIGLIVNSGATIYDLAAQFGTTPEELEKQLRNLGAPVPSMCVEGPFDFIKSLLKNSTEECPANILLDNSLGWDKNKDLETSSPPTEDIFRKSRAEKIYKAYHGPYIIDPYIGKPYDPTKLMFVDGNCDNYLITNIEAQSIKTTVDRYNHSIGLVTETFSFSTKYFKFSLTICKKYDQLVSGTYNPEYVNEIFNTWVIHPINKFFQRNIEEEVMFKHRTPMYIAWWSWAQLSHYALLKGIKSIEVSSLPTPSANAFYNFMVCTAVIKDSDVLGAIESMSIQERKTSTNASK